jgi:putative endopeptidase
MVDGLTGRPALLRGLGADVDAYKARPERVRQLAATDYHANSALRGFAPLLHLDAFHEAFDTRPGDPMWRDPAQRVTIW